MKDCQFPPTPSPRPRPLTRIVPFSQDFLTEVLREGDFAIDLTAGNGHDTLFLHKTVGPQGVVVAFDLQQQALEQTAKNLTENGVCFSSPQQPRAEWAAGVYLIHAGHERLGEFISRPINAAIANLGYLPGGDQRLVTKPETTRTALSASAELLIKGGRLAVVVYPGHAGGEDEADAVATWFENLHSTAWNVLRINSANQPNSPFLLVAEKR